MSYSRRTSTINPVEYLTKLLVRAQASLLEYFAAHIAVDWVLRQPRPPDGVAVGRRMCEKDLEAGARRLGPGL